MSNVLTKDLEISVISPAIQGDPGTPPAPAYCVTITSSSAPILTKYVIDENGDLQAIGYSGPSVPSTSTICYPATDGTPPTPGVPPNVFTQFNLGWNAGARSIDSLAADGAATFSVANAVVGVVVGLHAGVAGFTFSEAAHALYFHAGTVSVLESGVVKSASVPYTVADVFRIERVASVVRYFKGTALIHTSAVPSYGAQYLESSMYSGGDSVLNAALSVITTSGLGSGGASLRSLAARGGDVASSGGAVTLAPAAVSGTGLSEQGGGAVLQAFATVGSSGAYAGGGAELAPVRAAGESGTAPTFALGSARLGRVGSSGYGLTAGNTTTPGSVTLGPFKTLGSDYVYAGGGAVLAPMRGSGAEGVKLSPSLAVARVGRLSVAGYGLTSGSTIDPGGATLPALDALGANYAYSGGNATLAPLAAGTLTIAGYAHTSILAPAGRVLASVRDTLGANAAYVTAPMPTLCAAMGMHARAAAPIGQLAASATGTSLLSAALQAPAGSVAATGTFASTVRAAIRAPMARAVGYGGMVCSVTLTGKASVQAHVTSGSSLSAHIVGPMARLPLFSVETGNYLRAEITAPAGEMGGQLQAWISAPMATLSAVGTAVVVASYEAYSINLTHPASDQSPTDEVTRYTNFPFTHVVRYQGSYFGVAADGLYLLEGTTDNGAAIPYAVRTCADDFKAPELKNVASAYLAGRLGPLTVSLHAGEDGAESYEFDTLRGPLARNHREKFGRGVKNRYFALGLTGNGALELDSIELEINKMKRRI